MLAALERSVGAQRRLVADASHELRTPLTAARTNVDLLREGKLPDGRGEARPRRGVGRARRADEPRLRSRRAGARRGAASYGSRTFSSTISSPPSSSARRRARRRCGSSPRSHPHIVQADPVLLERAVSNLLDNAVKYSPDGAPIEVTVRGGEVVVADHGPGIADEDLPARLRPLLPRRDRALEAGRRPRPRDRPRGGRSARRHRQRGEHDRGRPLQARAAGAAA